MTGTTNALRGARIFQRYCRSDCPLYPRKQTYAVQNAMSALGHKRTSPVSSPKEGGRGLQYRLRPRNSLVDLESELLNNRRPESDVSGKGPAQFFRIRIENWFNAGVD